MPTFEGTKRGYGNLFAKMRVSNEQYEIARKAVQPVLNNQQRYEKVQALTGVPWYWIGITHKMESNCNFSTHLHNGDPLTARTVREPPGRPIKGQPPFTWDESAVDALRLKGLDDIYDWSLPRMLYEFERYNGWGYMLYRKTNSPYLWSFSSLQQPGKYVEDGKWNADAISEQVGAAVLLRVLIDMGVAEIDEPQTEEEAMEDFKKEVEPLRFLAPTLVNVALGEAVNLAVKALAEAFGPEKVDPSPEAVTGKLKEATYTQIRDVAGKAEAKIKELFPVEPLPAPLPDEVAAQIPPLPEPKPTSKIDTVVGGEAFKGLKTVIGVIGWAGVTIAGTLGYLDADTVTALQTAAGALIGVGLLAKIERAASWVVPIIRGFRSV